MAKNEESTVQEALPIQPPNPPKVDQFMEEAFMVMGYKKPFPKSLVMIHNSMKKRKDRLHPGRLTPEGFAMVATISDLFEGEFNSAKE